MKTVAQLISEGYGGYAGWKDPEAGYDYQATGGQGKYTGASSNTSTGGSSDRYVGGIDYSQVPSVQAFVESQFAGEDTALNDYLMAMKAQKSPMDIYSGLEAEAGLPNLRSAATSLSKEIGSLEDTLSGIEGGIAARTKQSLVTEAQRQGMVTAEKTPLWERLSKFTTNLGRIADLIGLTSGDISNKTQLYLQGQAQELEPYKLKYTALVDANSRKLSGFTADRQTWLELKLDEISRNRELDDQTWAQVNQIAQEKRAYTKSLQETAASMGYQVSGNETDQQLLEAIGQKAAEEIAYNRRDKSKTTTPLSAWVSDSKNNTDDALQNLVDQGLINLEDLESGDYTQ